MSQIAAQKAELRAHWKNQYPKDLAVRSELSKRLRTRIARESEFLNAEIVTLFSPLGSEPDITGLWELAPDRCFFPKVTQEGLEFYGISDLSELQPGYSRILEPPALPLKKANFSASRILLLVPGICFDLAGHRLGSGKGFYDRFIGSLTGKLSKKSRKPGLWGVCFDEQVSTNLLPQDPTDLTLSAIVTPTKLLEISA